MNKNVFFICLIFFLNCHLAISQNAYEVKVDGVSLLANEAQVNGKVFTSNPNSSPELFLLIYGQTSGAHKIQLLNKNNHPIAIDIPVNSVSTNWSQLVDRVRGEKAGQTKYYAIIASGITIRNMQRLLVTDGEYYTIEGILQYIYANQMKPVAYTDFVMR